MNLCCCILGGLFTPRLPNPWCTSYVITKQSVRKGETSHRKNSATGFPPNCPQKLRGVDLCCFTIF